MMRHVLVIACAAVSVMTIVGPTNPAKAQSAGAVFGGLAGGVIGGVIAGSIAAEAARQRPIVVYARPQRTVRVIHEVRPVPRRRVARAQPRPMTPTASPQGASVINASADPFAPGQGSATTAVKQTR